MSIKDKAVQLFKEGKYNCCQAVVCAYCDEQGMDDKEIFKLAEGFGGGMGGMQETCGALTGAFMSIGMIGSAGDKANPRATKQDTYQAVRDVAEEFVNCNGSMYCRDLKRMVDGKQVVSCQQCVETAAEIVERAICAKK